MRNNPRVKTKNNSLFKFEMEDSAFYNIPFHHGVMLGESMLGQARSIPNESEQMAGSYWLSLYKTWPTTGISPNTLIQVIALFLVF